MYYIKFQENIYVIDNFYSITNGLNDYDIRLIRVDGNSFSIGLTIPSDIVINYIWNEMKKENKFIDLDEFFILHNDTTKYNL